MGTGDSKQQEPSILQVFTPGERESLHKLFVRIVGTQQQLTEPFLKKYLPAWYPQPDILYKVIYDCQANRDLVKENKITELQFGVFLAQCLKGTPGEKSDILCLLCGQVGGEVSDYRLYQTTFAIVKCYLALSGKDAPATTWKSSVTDVDIGQLCCSFFTMAIIPTSDSTERRSQYAIENWLASCPFFMRMFDRVFYTLFPVVMRDNIQNICQSFLPVVTNVDWKKTTTILDTLSISYLNNHIPREQQSKWRLLYSNSVHGDSFSQLTRFIIGKGANILIVRDKDGHVFGAYVSEGWEIKPGFYGNSNCFLFTLKPRYGIYCPTGYNENHMYLNQGQETLPNGLGLGGQLNYFGLWIDYSFNSGHSKAKPKCTTYGSPQLSGSPEFAVDGLEVWAVGPEKKQDSDDEEGRNSILDKDVAAKAILELAGRKQHSEGLRELGEEEAPLTEEQKRKMNVIPKLL